MKKRLANCNNIGKLTGLVGLLLLVPLLVLPFYPDEADNAVYFIVPAVFSVVLGLLVCVIFKKSDKNASIEELTARGNLTVLYIWIYACLIGAMPFFLSHRLTFVQALFEAVSGWTTTGLSVVDVSDTPQIFLFYRSFMQFCGGLGFVMVMIAFIQGKQSMDLYNAEGHPDKIMPNLRETVQVIFVVYIGCLVAGTIAYVICGMPVFDSIIHTMGALSTGGFSNRVDSIGTYNSVAIEGVTIVLMLIGTTNFAVLLLMLRRKFKQAFRTSELKFLGGLLLIFVPLTAFSLATNLYMSLGESFRQALFNIVSALSTTGYCTLSYQNWPGLALGAMILMMLIGGGLGSTAGGMKLTRVLILLKSGWNTVRSKLVSEHEVTTPYYYRVQGKTPITDSLVKSTSGFICCYLVIYIFGALAITVTAGVPLAEGMFEFASSLSTVGLSIGITGTATNAATLIVEICGMFLGRLEIYIVLTGFYSAFRMAFRKRSAA